MMHSSSIPQHIALLEQTVSNSLTKLSFIVLVRRKVNEALG